MAFKNPLSLYERLHLRLFYGMKLLRYDLPENQVGWRSRRTQEARFGALEGIGDLKGRRLLDLGCGLGCLYGWLKGRGWEGDYTGYDLLGSMVKRARKRFPEARFEARDLLADPPGATWDYVLINGIFNHRVADNWDWIGRTVSAAFARAERGLAMNLLNGEEDSSDPEMFYATPGELERRAREWSGGKAEMMRGYLHGDMTVYLRK
jgi:SAM-dependent methyltransferase